MRHSFKLGILWMLSMTACSDSTMGAPGPGEDPQVLPAAMCAPLCSPANDVPAGDDPVTTCYDGCNWCTCTEDGPINCTARGCEGDGGTTEDGGDRDGGTSATDGGPVAPTDAGPMVLPASMCSPVCNPTDTVPPGDDPAVSTCYDGCNWCTCTEDGPINCTARACDGG